MRARRRRCPPPSRSSTTRPSARPGWRWFLAGLGDRLADDLPGRLDTPAARSRFADLLAQQRWHAAFHYRQLVAHREETGRRSTSPFAVHRLVGLDLPLEVF